MRVLVVGGGPGGLYTALLIKRRNPHAHVAVVDRNRPDDTTKSLRYVTTLTQSWVHSPVFVGDHNPRTV